MSKDNLRPCPFCGSEKVKKIKSAGVIYCSECGVRIPIDNWNNRPIEDALECALDDSHKLISEYLDEIKLRDAEIAELKHAVEQLGKSAAEYACNCGALQDMIARLRANQIPGRCGECAKNRDLYEHPDEIGKCIRFYGVDAYDKEVFNGPKLTYCSAFTPRKKGE